MTVTSAMKGLGATVNTMLAAVQAGEFANYGGKVENLGLVSEDPELNYVQLPSATTQFGEGFSAEDYVKLVGDMFNGVITVNNDISISAADNATVIAVNDQGNLK
jgi:basic membrane protein A